MAERPSSGCQGSRERVREYAAKATTLASARTTVSSMQGDMRTLEAERKALSEERAVQAKITEKYWNEQKELDAQIEDIFKERRRIKDLQVGSACDFPKLLHGTL